MKNVEYRDRRPFQKIIRGARNISLKSPQSNLMLCSAGRLVVRRKRKQEGKGGKAG